MAACKNAKADKCLLAMSGIDDYVDTRIASPIQQNSILKKSLRSTPYGLHITLCIVEETRFVRRRHEVFVATAGFGFQGHGRNQLSAGLC